MEIRPKIRVQERGNARHARFMREEQGVGEGARLGARTQGQKKKKINKREPERFEEQDGNQCKDKGAGKG